MTWGLLCTIIRANAGLLSIRHKETYLNEILLKNNKTKQNKTKTTREQTNQPTKQNKQTYSLNMSKIAAWLNGGAGLSGDTRMVLIDTMINCDGYHSLVLL